MQSVHGMDNQNHYSESLVSQMEKLVESLAIVWIISDGEFLEMELMDVD